MLFSLIYREYHEYSKQKYLYNYILYKNVRIIKRPKECDDYFQCDYITSSGKMKLSGSKFKDIQHFDIGIKIGTCHSSMYAKIYTNDALKPFYFMDIITIKFDDDSYLIYKEKFNLPPQPKCE